MPQNNTYDQQQQQLLLCILRRSFFDVLIPTLSSDLTLCVRMLLLQAIVWWSQVQPEIMLQTPCSLSNAE